IANLVRGCVAAGFVGDAHFIAGDRRAARARPNRAGAIGKKHVADLGRTDAVEDLDAGLFSPALEDAGRKRLSGAGAEAYAAEIRGSPAFHRRQQLRIGGRHSEEESPAGSADLVEDSFRRWTGGEENGSGAHVEGEVLSVAQPIGEEELGDGETAVFRLDVQDLLAIRAAADPGIVLEMNHALGLSGRSARVEKE